MRLHQFMGGVVSAASIVMCQACHGSSGDGAAPTTSASSPLASAAADAGPPPKPRMRVPRHGGIAASLFHDAHELDLSQAEQDGLPPIEASLKADDDGIRGAMKTFRADLTAGVKAGKLDTAKLTADDAVVDKAMTEHAAAEGAALDSLHALLTPEHRSALVTTIRTRQGEREARTTAWLKNKEPDGGAPDWSKRRLDRLSAQLTLDAAQQKQVAALLAKAKDPPNADGFEARWEDHKKRTDALLTAFGADTFDGKKVDLTLLPGKTTHEALDHIATFLTQLVPILRPDQRERLGGALDRPLGGGWAARSALGGPMAMGPPATRDVIDDIAFPFSEPPPGREEREPPMAIPPPSPPPSAH
jgi:Spy/CpxP family protein refolding chaperone